MVFRKKTRIDGGEFTVKGCPEMYGGQPFTVLTQGDEFELTFPSEWDTISSK